MLDEGERHSNTSELSSKESKPKAKKVKPNSEDKKPAKPKGTRKKTAAVNRRPAASTPSTIAQETPAYAIVTPIPLVHEATSSESVDLKPSIYTDTPLNTSFNSTGSVYNGFDDPSYESTPFLGRQPFGYHDFNTFQRPIEVHNVHGVAQPQFEATPNVPIVRPMDLTLGADTYGPMYSQTGMPRINNEFSVSPYGNFKSYNSYDPHMGLNGHQQAHAGQVYNANMHAQIGVPAEHGHYSEWGYPNGLPSQHQVYTPFEYVPPATLPGGVHHGFTGHSRGTGTFPRGSSVAKLDIC